MKAKTILQVAEIYEKKLAKLAQSNFPEPNNVYPIVKRVVDTMKTQSPLLKSVNGVAAPVNVQNTIDNTCYVYFQLVVLPERYNQLIEEPAKSELSNLLKPKVEEALSAQFRTFRFQVKVGVVPE